MSRQLGCETVQSPQPVRWVTPPEIVVHISHVAVRQQVTGPTLPEALALPVCVRVFIRRCRACVCARVGAHEHMCVLFVHA